MDDGEEPLWRRPPARDVVRPGRRHVAQQPRFGVEGQGGHSGGGAAPSPSSSGARLFLVFFFGYFDLSARLVSMTDWPCWVYSDG